MANDSDMYHLSLVRRQGIIHFDLGKPILFEQQFSLISVNFLIDTVLNCEFMFHTGEQNIGEQEDLRYGECQCYPKVEIGVRRSRVDPLMPYCWSEDCAKQYKTAYNESLLHI